MHGGRDGRRQEVDAAFGQRSQALLPYLDEEETILFPALAGAGVVVGRRAWS